MNIGDSVPANYVLMRQIRQLEKQFANRNRKTLFGMTDSDYPNFVRSEQAKRKRQERRAT